MAFKAGKLFNGDWKGFKEYLLRSHRKAVETFIEKYCSAYFFQITLIKGNSFFAEL